MPEERIVIVENIEYFLSAYQIQSDGYYKHQYKILSNLVDICKEELVNPCILIPYKEEGDCIFDLQSANYNNKNTLVLIYLFRSTIS